MNMINPMAERWKSKSEDLNLFIYSSQAKKLPNTSIVAYFT